MKTAEHARRRRRRYQQALAHDQRRHRAQVRVEPVRPADNLYATVTAWTAFVVLVLVAVVVAASL